MKNSLRPVNHNINLSMLKIAISSLCLNGITNVYAADFEKQVTINSELTHFSNPGMSENKHPVTVLKIEPILGLSLSNDLNKLYFNGALAIYRNSNEKVLPDRENPNLTAGWERALPAGLVGLEANYNETTSLNEELRRTGASTNSTNSETKSKQLLAKFNHDFNDKFSIKNEAVYNDVNYTGGTSTLTDYSLYGARSRLVYQYSDFNSPYFQLSHYQIEPNNSDPRTKISRATIGLASILSNTFDIDTNVGLYKTTGASSRGGLEAEVLAKYNLERALYTANISQKLSPGGVEDFQKAINFALGAKYLLDEYQTIGAEYLNLRSKLDSGSTSTNIRNQSIGAFYTRTFKDWQMRVGAKLMEIDNAGSTSYGNEVGVSLSYGPLTF